MKKALLKADASRILYGCISVLIFGVAILTTSPARAQSGTRVTGPLTSTGMLGQYYNYSNGEIVFGTGFESTPGSGQSFEAYIYNDPCPPLTLTPGNNNYIATFVPRIPGITQLSQLANRSPCDVMQSIEYMDDLGRPVQSVQVNASPTLRDIVQPMAYDVYQRQPISYLPYASTVANDGSYKANAITNQGTFYSGTTGVVSTGNPYAVTVFENSPLNRPAEQGAAGAAWQPGAGHTMGTVYGSNAASAIRRWAATGTNGASCLKAGSPEYYPVATLSKTTVTDENGNASSEYKNTKGQVVCKEVMNGATPYRTYYVYDDLDNLVYVIPQIPSGTTYPNSFVESDAVFSNYMYGYHYDKRQRLFKKKIPGKGWEYMVYNNLDQVVATQDSLLKGDNKWTYTKYDPQGRVVISGIHSSAASRATLQDTLNSQTVYWETRTSSYSNGAWPTTGNKALTVSYFDDYSISGLPGGYSLTGASSMTKSLPTASQTGVLGAGDMLWKVMVYDDNGRVNKSYAQHYLGGSTALSNNNYDQVGTTYNFTNQTIVAERKHYKNVSNAAALQLTLRDSLFYDHMNRPIYTKNKINSLAEVIPSRAVYNEIGQLMTKRLHSENSGSNFLQDVTYSYNERGWLNTSNTSGGLFNVSLGYNSGSAPQWNGNISQMTYGYAAPPSGTATNRTFNYTYDNLNRLTIASLASGTSLNETLSYDELGNIASLARGGVTYGTLGYAYSGNQLTGVTGTGFTGRSYSYDGNGNAKSDGGSKAIEYNILNLPNKVKVGGTTIMTYVYDAGGQKLRSESTADGTREYIGGINYEGSGIKTIATAEGRITNNAGVYSYQYDLKDHLGNVRVTFDKNPSGGAARIIQQDEYYSFGLRSALYDNSNGNRYLYNGKERQADLTDQYDYGARFYDPVIGRWYVVDREAEDEMQIDKSPYAYAWNNAVNLDDPDGDCPMCIGALAGALFEYGTQVVTNVVTDGKLSTSAFTNVDGKKVFMAGLAGAAGVGIGNVASRVGSIGSKLVSSNLGQKIIKEAANLTGDAVASVAGSKLQGKEVTLAGVAADVSAGVIGRGVTNKVAANARNSPEGKRLARVADRAARVGASRESRKAAIEATKKAAESYGAGRAAVAGAVGSGVASTGTNAIIDANKKKKE